MLTKLDVKSILPNSRAEMARASQASRQQRSVLMVTRSETTGRQGDAEVDSQAHSRLKEQHSECVQEMQAILGQAEVATAKVESLTRQLSSQTRARIEAEEVARDALKAQHDTEERVAVLELQNESAERERVRVVEVQPRNNSPSLTWFPR